MISTQQKHKYLIKIKNLEASRFFFKLPYHNTLCNFTSHNILLMITANFAYEFVPHVRKLEQDISSMCEIWCSRHSVSIVESDNLFIQDLTSWLQVSLFQSVCIIALITLTYMHLFAWHNLTYNTIFLWIYTTYYDVIDWEI